MEEEKSTTEELTSEMQRLKVIIETQRESTLDVDGTGSFIRDFPILTFLVQIRTSGYSKG